jgi:hypothetical protein
MIWKCLTWTQKYRNKRKMVRTSAIGPKQNITNKSAETWDIIEERMRIQYESNRPLDHHVAGGGGDDDDDMSHR